MISGVLKTPRSQDHPLSFLRRHNGDIGEINNIGRLVNLQTFFFFLHDSIQLTTASKA